MKPYSLLTALILGLGLTVVSLWFLNLGLTQPVQAAPPVHPTQAELTTNCTNGIGNVTDLINAVRIANNEATNPGPDVIILGANCVYTLTSPGDTITNTFGKTGLPAITSTIIISGNGATIQRALTATNDFDGSFRLMYVGPGGNLTLQNLTLRNGLAQGADGA